RPPDQQSARFVSELSDSWARAARDAKSAVRVPDVVEAFAESPRDVGYYYQPDQTAPGRNLLLVTLYEKEYSESLGKATESVEAIRRSVREEAKNFPEFRIGLTGRTVLYADEMKTSDRDGHRSETLALIVVFIG